MGRILQIRVTATTYRPEDVGEAWPRLSALAWPHPPQIAGPPVRERGVLELVGTLDDRVRFVLEDGTLRQRVVQRVEAAAGIVADLEAALADWDAARANLVTQELEAALDELEALAPEAPFVVSKPDAKGGGRPGGDAGGGHVASRKSTSVFSKIARSIKGITAKTGD